MVDIDFGLVVVLNGRRLSWTYVHFHDATKLTENLSSSIHYLVTSTPLCLYVVLSLYHGSVFNGLRSYRSLTYIFFPAIPPSFFLNVISQFPVKLHPVSGARGLLWQADTRASLLPK